MVGVDVGPHRLSAAPAVHHGGPRLQPAHFEPDRVPPEVARYGTDAGTSAAGTLAVGSPGKVGVLELDFELRGPSGRRRTELVHHYQKTPLQIMRPLYFDEARPDMPFTYVMTTGGGVLHGDRQRSDLRFGPGTSAHVTTQAHTKVHRMEHGYASAIVNLDIADDAYVEHLPDPLIPYAGARFYQHTHVVLAESATVLLGETLYAGRLSRGERNAYDVFASDLEVVRPDGRPVMIDRFRLEPRAGRLGGLAVLDDRDIVATLYVLTALQPARAVADRLHEAMGATIVDDTRFGVSVLPGDSGAWLRMVGDDTVTMARAWTAAWGAAHELLTGTPAPHIRK